MKRLTYEELQNRLRRNVAKIMKAEGISLYKVEKETGIGRSTMKCFLDGRAKGKKGRRVNFSLRTLLKLCECFECDIEDFFGR